MVRIEDVDTLFTEVARLKTKAAEDFPVVTNAYAEIARLNSEVERLKAALNLLLDSVDYTVGNCNQTQMVGAVLSRTIIHSARLILGSFPEPPEIIK
jgi:hypothetical protein